MKLGDLKLEHLPKSKLLSYKLWSFSIPNYVGKILSERLFFII